MPPIQPSIFHLLRRDIVAAAAAAGGGFWRDEPAPRAIVIPHYRWRRTLPANERLQSAADPNDGNQAGHVERSSRPDLRRNAR